MLLKYITTTYTIPKVYLFIYLFIRLCKYKFKYPLPRR